MQEHADAALQRSWMFWPSEVVQRPTVFEVAEVLLMTVVVKSGGRLSLAVDGDGGAVCGIDTILYSV